METVLIIIGVCILALVVVTVTFRANSGRSKPMPPPYEHRQFPPKKNGKHRKDSGSNGAGSN